MESSSAVDDNELNKKKMATACRCACNCTTVFTRDYFQGPLIVSFCQWQSKESARRRQLSTVEPEAERSCP